MLGKSESRSPDMKLRNLFSIFTVFVLICSAFAQTKTTPARDPKTGQFVSSKDTKKSEPARDPKTGRYVSTKDKKKSEPARDPKTGRYVSTKDSSKKSEPARDPKTGRYIKKS